MLRLIQNMGVVLETILYKNVCQLLTASEWFSPCYTLVSTTDMIDLIQLKYC